MSTLVHPRSTSSRMCGEIGYVLCPGCDSPGRGCGRQLVFDTAADAAMWRANNPAAVIGTTVVVGGIAMIVATGPGGALVLLAL